MNVFDGAQTLWNDQISHTFGDSGANYGTGSEMRVRLREHLGRCHLGRLAFWAFWVQKRVRSNRPRAPVQLSVSLGPFAASVG